MSSERSVKDLSGLYIWYMSGAKGFEPSTSWSRNSVSKILKALSGVAYARKKASFPFSVVPKLYPKFCHLNNCTSLPQSRERLPWAPLDSNNSVNFF
jgi:hypothetical protein